MDRVCVREGVKDAVEVCVLVCEPVKDAVEVCEGVPLGVGVSVSDCDGEEVCDRVCVVLEDPVGDGDMDWLRELERLDVPEGVEELV